MMLVAIIALLLAVVGFGTVRTAPAFARWFALLAAIAFLVVVSLEDRTESRSVPPRLQQADLIGGAVEARTSMLLAAAMAGPRVSELQLRWQPSSAEAARTASPAVALGATAIAPESLSIAPTDVHIRAMSVLQAERPALFEVDVTGLQQPLTAELTVGDGVDGGFRESLSLGPKPTSVAFTPMRAGQYEIALQIRVGAHQVKASGVFVVVAPEEVLVVEPSGVVAAALRTQGERVRESSGLPSDWSRHSRIVLGREVPIDQQQALVRAVEDGAGLFVLANAFGDVGMPLRQILPLTPLPPLTDPVDAEGDAASESQEVRSDQLPDESPPALEPPPTEPPVAEPPVAPNVGDTKGHKPVSEDLVEVDKHSIGMVLVVDRSGSMGTPLSNGRTKMSYAKESALRTAQALDVGDRVGVVTFGDRERSKVELPLTDVSDMATVRAGIKDLVHRREMTYLLGGLRQARTLLKGEPAAVKHVVVITDGEFQPGQSMALVREANNMRGLDKITLSIISIIDASTEPGFKAKAEVVADAGGGEFIATNDVKAVPVIVSSEVSRALSRVGRKPRRPARDGDAVPDPPPPKQTPKEQEEPDEPKPDPKPKPESEAPKRLPVRAVVDSLLLMPEPSDWPSLGSAVRSEAPLAARVLLVVGDEGWPLLAFANRGLGRVGAFGADLGGEDGRAFREAAAFPAWLAQWLAATAAASELPEAADLRERGAVEPPAPVPADVTWLSAVGGGLPVTEAATVPAAVGRGIVEQVSDAAPLLLAILLLLAICERLTSWYALRRGSY